MKRIKEMDLGIQLSLIMGSLIYSGIVMDYRMLYCYLVVGGWQLLSCLFHAVTRYPYLPSPGRRYYLRTLAWTFGIGILSIPFAGLLFFLALLFVSPFFAIWYTFICAEEITQLKRRELAQFR
ncbi:hypothetical protein JMG10_27830 [Nostoc ellipsosporum NOK]|nr:hypothetical protein [Nostoc ellipsosporum NOK]